MKRSTFEYLKQVDAELTNLDQLAQARVLWFHILKQLTRIADSIEYFEMREKGF